MKKKLGLIVDSTSGLTVQEAKELGVGLIPHTININGVDYFAGDNLDHNKLFSFMKNDKETFVKTTLPNGKMIEDALRSALEIYEKVVVVAISKKFSGTLNSIRLYADNNEEFYEKVFVHDGEFSSPWMNLYVREMAELIKEYEDPREFMKLLDRTNKYMTGFLTPGNIWWFYKGGRITKMQYMIGSISKISPILTVSEGEINKSTTIKIRGQEKAMIKMAELVKEEIERLGLKEGQFKYVILETSSKSLAEKTMHEFEKVVHTTKENIIVERLSVDQCSHMGPDSYGITFFVPLSEIIKGDL